MTLSVVMLVVVMGAFLVAVRRLVPVRPYLFQGMFRYESDLGWPHGVQEEDGERAWVAHTAPAWDPEEDELAWAASIGTSMIVERDGDRPLVPVAIVRVKADVSMARLSSEGAGLPSEGAAVTRRMTWRTARRTTRHPEP